MQMPATESDLTATLRLLGDPTRLRILALVEREELSVGELCRALQMSQSRVSNHLRILRDAGLLAERHAGVSTFVRLGVQRNGAVPARTAGRLWGVLRNELPGLTEHRADLVRLEEVLQDRRSREGEFFDRVAGEWDKIAGEFSNGQGRYQTALHLLPPDRVVADLGCGTGYMARALLGHCRKIICIDRSKGMLEQARRRLDPKLAQGTGIEFRQGELDALPLEDGEVDGLVAGMVLHHLRALDPAVAEMRRVLVPGAAAAVMELAPHREEWMRHTLGDRHLGLAPKDVAAAFRRSGFEDVMLDPVSDRYRPRPGGEDAEGASLAMYIVRARRPHDMGETEGQPARDDTRRAIR